MISFGDVVKVRLDISRYWPKTPDGIDQSVNSVYASIEGTDLEVGRNTLRLAKTGQLDRGLFENVFKLQMLCSKWAGEEITLPEIFEIDP